MKVACQHLLRRRDLSCTKVNAVNRLSNCLYASFRLSKEEAALRQRPPGSPREGRAESRRQQAAAAGAGGSAGSRQTDAALQTGKDLGP